MEQADQNNGPNNDAPDPFQPPSGMVEEVEDDIALGEEMGDYPPLAAPNNCAKDWDVSLLQNCTARRLQSIAKDYEGVNARQNKVPLFKDIYNAMLEDQTCGSCPEGKCNPAIHFFNPLENPPHGWVRGPDGIFVKSQAPPRSVSQPGTSHSLDNPGNITTGSPTVPPPALPSSTVQQASFPGVNPLQSTLTTTLDTYVRPPGASPSRGLLNPSGSLDLPVASGVSPYIQGVYQAPPAQRDPAQFVMQGAAAAAAASNLGVSTRSQARALRPQPPATTAAPAALNQVDANTLEQTRQSIEAAKQ